MEAAWLAAVILTPLFFNIYSSRIFEPDKITLLRTLALVILAAWIVKLMAEEGPRWERLQPEESFVKFIWRMPLIALVSGLAAVYGVATVFSVTPSVSLLGSYQRLQGTYTTFSYLVIFAAIVGNMRKRAQVERLVTSVIVTSLPITLYGLLQRYKLDPVPWGGDVSIRIAANLGNSIFVAAYLIMAFPLTVARIVDSFDAILQEERLIPSIVRSTIYVFTAAMQLIALYMSGSRGPVLGWLAGSFFLFLLLALHWRIRWLVTGFVALALAGGAFLFVYNLEGGPLEELRDSRLIGRFSSLLDPESNSALVRKYIWEGAADLVSPHPPLEYPDGRVDQFNFLRPLVGYGPESMYVAFNPFYPPELAHVERRNASPDRSHNETWDSVVTTGIAGLVVYIAVFTTVFYYGLKWLGLVQGPRQRQLFMLLYFGGGLVGGAGLGLWRGLAYMGVGLPFGMAIGLIIYLAVVAISTHREPPATRGEAARSLILIALMAAIMGHFVEINFGIAIAVTRTYFWAFAGTLLVLGYILPKYGDYLVVTSEEREESHQGTSKAANEGNRKTRGRRRRADKDQVRLRLPGWLPKALLAGLILGLILATLGYNYLALSEQATTVKTIIEHSVIRLRTANDAVSFGILGLVVMTWLAAGMLLAAESDRFQAQSGWGKQLGVILGMSALIGLVFWLWQANELASIAHLPVTDLASVMDRVRGFESLLSNYYLYAFGLVFISAITLPEEWPTALTSRERWGVMGALAALILVPYVAFTTNLRVVQADIAFKIADPFVKEASWPVAIAIYDHAIEMAPAEDFYYLFLGRAYLEYGRDLQDPVEREQLIVQARDDLRKAQSINPLNTDHTANLARLYSLWASFATDPQTLTERGETAIDYFTRAVTLSPNNARLWDEWALLYLTVLDNPTEAYARLSQALAIDNQYDWTHGLLGDYYYQQAQGLSEPADQRKMLDQAGGHYQEAIELAPLRDSQNKYSYALGLAGVQVQANQAQQAIQSYELALELAPNTPDRWRIEETMGKLYVQAGDEQQALVHLSNALALAPSNEMQRLQDLIGQLQSQQ